jgi:hypothetical protein
MHVNLPIALVIGIACAVQGYRLAGRRNRSQVIASIVCFTFGLVGLGIYALATRKPKQAPAAMTELAPMP